MSNPFRLAGRLFGDLKVRPKLMVLHNLFFLVLTCGVYFALVPLFEGQVESARRREERLIQQMFAAGDAVLDLFDDRTGTAAELDVPPAARVWLEEHPDAVWQGPDGRVLYRRAAGEGRYRRLRLPVQLYDDTLRRVRWTLFVVLGVVYVLAVFTLEAFVMPQYVYRPLRLMLSADQATQRGDRARELIGDAELSGDEIGQIMRSRNATVGELRRQEDTLEEALKDLRRKNIMLEAARRNLLEQDRLASLGLLSASVAHELNTPLSVLRGSVEKMLEDAGDDVSRDRLNRMLRVTQRLQKISETLVDFSVARRVHHEPVPARPLIDESWNLVAISEKAGGVRFENHTRADDVILGNADRLAQVFVNLLRNALYAVPPGGRIGVESRREIADDGAWVVLSVEDDGPGIPADVLPDIFDAFVTTRLDARGTGLGLTVAEGIVHQHGGTISASNREGGGARLEVRLPAGGAGRMETDG